MQVVLPLHLAKAVARKEVITTFIPKILAEYVKKLVARWVNTIGVATGVKNVAQLSAKLANTVGIKTKLATTVEQIVAKKGLTSIALVCAVGAKKPFVR